MYWVFIIQCDIFETKVFLKCFQNYENVKNVQLSKDKPLKSSAIVPEFNGD